MSRSIFGNQRFMNFAVHQDEEQPDTELFLQIVLLLHITLLVGILEGKKRIVDGGEGERWEKSVFNNRENGFPYFIYVVAIISI